ncbi:T9SS type A sorting domain-containing protein [Algoriphagus sp. CAU 1675]|uniref:T9SS type A sorting domain-containing protein n=1 Tax=Algoriphagus sp. CAU 1675 TaxID=3032597 RepID=UPI0023DCB160|nr:T9SS type A sorting domain-containing protein [Algoriphagus sp. CAU 1675]MDF2158115.1 T9SS type A sorting domain-containing protein [Algoriphagus sp. CAU 1675]
MDTQIWENEGASYSETIGIETPSLGAILFNGVDENGTPYSRAIRDQGEADFLTSGTFDFSALPNSEKETVYLSFFWQGGGKAELPDENDKLVLQFLNSDNLWISIWEQKGGSELDPTVFKQEMIQVTEEFQHSGFRFRFFNQGRQSGPFDSWLLDYVFLGKNRSEGSTSYLDRSLTKPNYFRIGEFGAYPFELWAHSTPVNLSRISNQFLNLQDRFRAMEYTITMRDTLSESVYAVNLNTPFNPVPNILERRDFESRIFEDIPEGNTETTLEITTFLTSGDKYYYELNGLDTVFYESVDFRINDTVKTYFPLKDFFAYDNGSADYAAGINQKSGYLAVKYTTQDPIYLKGISINFTNPLQANQAIDILVWNDLDEEPIFRREDLIPVKDSPEDFIYYPLEENIQVTGDFYIGFAQFTDDFIHVGLDKTTNKGDKIFYNVVGAWAQNEEVEGSLMIRPHVSLTAPYEESSLPGENLRIFPNPVESVLNVIGTYQNLRVFDSFGREIFPEREERPNGEIINFIGHKPGIYVINLIGKDGPDSIRVLVR